MRTKLLETEAQIESIHLYCWPISTLSKEAQSKIQTIKTVTAQTICRILHADKHVKIEIGDTIFM
jgi:hypothetical protein